MAMTKVERQIVPANGMDSTDISSFTTENYVGIWNGSSKCFTLIKKTEATFCPVNTIGIHYTLQELDDEVYKICNEHILTVSDKSIYIFSLVDEN